METEFLERIRTLYIPQVQRKNKQIQAVFDDVNRVAKRNIKQIYEIITSSEFVQLVDELDPIPVFSGCLCSLLSKTEKLAKQLEPYKDIPQAQFYYYVLAKSTGRLEVKAGSGYIEVNDKIYSSWPSLYYSEYRLFFYGYDCERFKKEVENYLCRIGVIEND